MGAEQETIKNENRLSKDLNTWEKREKTQICVSKQYVRGTYCDIALKSLEAVVKNKIDMIT